ncbi:hypothetical protein C1646_630756 [Rhizophagus diaphanus]|nr:hypothetical protein C1646_630756 [Rhizophagus diaphanus] [Rhizophagus sp. MUCL 43196]
MTSKSEKLYRRLFDNLLKFAEENGVYLAPSYIITDFEQAVINSTRYEFPAITSKGYFFRLGQNYWRKIRDCGLDIKYGNDEQFSLMLRHLYALSFLPPQEIPAAFDILKSIMPQEANEVVQWFEENYVLGRIIRQMRNGNVTRDSPPFPPALWSVYDSIQLGIPRTQNIVEAWHHRWGTLVGEPHVGVFTIIKELQKEQQQVDCQVECILHGE